ncbi:MAG TPA: ribulose-phosphate 3-epimerase [Lachnospiraceae bacterium]|jgi:ribulose-phosphate 3-epimerase|nr:ribulose-phosphate 3-epimerase [Lachnospiraceae bacterium]
MRNEGIISASMMCEDLVHLTEDIRIFEEESMDYLHIDVMDGDFTPNLGLGVDYIRGLRGLTDIPLDLHLMIERPEEKYDWFGIRKNDIVTIHFESTVHIERAVEKLGSFGCKVFLAINPGTPVYSCEELLDSVDGISLLCVNPGFAGQPIVKGSFNKMKRLREFLDERGYGGLEVEVDGNISNENAGRMRELGADIFVAGSSSIFKKNGKTLRENIRSLRASIGAAGLPYSEC